MDHSNTPNTYKLPESYGETKIVLVARDPNCLFAYWEISGIETRRFIDELGIEFWQKSSPALKVKNLSNGSNFIIVINDYANNWYIHVDNINSFYEVEYGRKISERFFIPIVSSNYVLTPSNSVSSSASCYFMDYRNFSKSGLEKESRYIYEMLDMESYYKNIGISSMEFAFNSKFEQCFGISSLELFGKE
ncbi:DUF4912 domain-containing protein [Pseudobacteroides cellulosolvens]|uniref:DUF4912 domain-containing protein n=1 Tax=Pseudobacteroides cellulosolvens ATCC 35603 = DSM 2933 TaxID=398512 RepID=A0A0L6JGG4_9FIRM|nr:DUF4912 domain-containing protein [Pseudobacteroides cellulosolvens]KNY24794.1 hypothetical protein Bccel_0051 [Pseudobacteroides cellulosolvens ATCC 35603 = DSM 2933]